MFLDWKNQYCENDCTTQSNLQIQCNPYQTTNGILHKIRTKNFTVRMETQKTPNSQSNLFCNFFKNLFIYLFNLFMAVLGLRFCARAFSSCSKQGPLFIVVRGPLTIAASLVAEHRLQTCRLSNCSSRSQPLRGMWDLPRPGLEPVSPALVSGFSTTAPPGKPQSNLEKENWRNQAPRLQTIPQSYSNQDSMVLSQKQKYRSMVQDRMPRDKPMHIWSPNLR